MEECQHLELEKTVDKTNDGAPIYYCKAKCGVGLLVVRPLVIAVMYGRPTAIDISGLPTVPPSAITPELPAPEIRALPAPENEPKPEPEALDLLNAKNAQVSNAVTDNAPAPAPTAQVICGHTETLMGVQTGRTCKLPAGHDAGDSLIAHQY